MTAWSDVGLVLAGSAGPLAITVINNRTARRNAEEERLRTGTDDTKKLYADFLAAATQVHSAWRDYAYYAPSSFEQERLVDQRRDEVYDTLNHASARIRLSAPETVLAAAEDVLAAIRASAEAARACQRGSQTPDLWATCDESFKTSRKSFFAAARASMP